MLAFEGENFDEIKDLTYDAFVSLLVEGIESSPGLDGHGPMLWIMVTKKHLFLVSRCSSVHLYKTI